MPGSTPKNAFLKMPAGYIPGIVAGLVVGYSRLRPEWAPAQIPALALLAWSMAKTGGIVGRLRPGFWFGATMAGVVLGNVGVPIPAAAILFVAMTAYWMALGAGLSHLLQRPGLAGIFGAAGLLTLGEWAQSEALPMFGTAQRLASAWVGYDALLPISRVSGTLGVTFVVGALAVLLARRASAFICHEKVDTAPSPLLQHADDKLVNDPKNRRRPESGEDADSTGWFNTRKTGLLRDLTWIVGTATVVVGTFLSLSIWLNNSLAQKYGPNLTVAVCGSKSAAGAFLAEADFLKKYRPMLAEAAAKGAKLVVTPEMGLFVKDAQRDATLARLAGEARKLGVAWVVGYAQSGPSLNRAVLLNGDAPDNHGRDAGATAPATVGVSYDKTHWVPYMETYARHGDSAAVTGTLDGVKVGLMICQDDNYEDVAKNLSRAGVQIAAVPTFDWKGVEFAHLQSARNRPREFGFVEARAAIGGVSAIIDPTGKIVASRNHLVEGDGMTFATVNIDGGATTLFARLGNAPGLILSVMLVANALRRRRNPAGYFSPTVL